METPTINNMKPEAIMRKPAFKRILPGGNLTALGSGLMQGNTNAPAIPLAYENVTPEDCMREYDMNAHKIYSKQYYPNPMSKETYVDDEGIERTRYYEKELSRCAVDLIQMFHTQRTSLLVGSNTDLRIVSRKATEKEKDLLAGFQEGWELKNMENARYELISRAGKTMDAAICCYLDSGEFGWRALSFEDGDTCYPHYDPLTGKLTLFGRSFTYENPETGDKTLYLDVWDKTNHIRYRCEKDATKGTPTWVVDKGPTAHGFNSCPIAYVRYGEPFWGSAIHPGR